MSRNKQKKTLFKIMVSFALVLMIVLSGNLDAKAASKTLKLDKDASYTNAQLSEYTTINLNGHKMTVKDNFTTSASITLGTGGELVVKGNMTASGEVHVAGGVLTVNGTYKQLANQLNLGYSSNPTKVTITKDFIFDKTGYIYAGSDNTKISVGGNYTYKSAGKTSSNSAEITVAGNVTQAKDTGMFWAGNLVLNGKNQQTLTFQENSRVKSVDAQNSNVKLIGYLNGTELKSDFAPVMDGKLVSAGLNLKGHKFTVPVDLDVTSEVTIGTNGALIVKGNMTASDTVNVSYGSLTVNGSYTQTSGSLGGSNSIKITVKKNLSFTNSGYPYFNSASGKVSVGGNLVYKSIKDSSYNYAEVTVSGDVTQAKDAGKFLAGELVLNGKKQQVLTFQEKSAVKSITAKNSNVKLVGYLNGTTLKTDFSPEMDKTLKTNNGIYLNGHTFNVPVDLEASAGISTGVNGKLIVNGNMTVAGRVSVENGTLEVKGNYKQTAESLYNTYGSARVSVAKDMIFEQTGSIYMSGSNSKIDVKGSVYYRSAKDTKFNDAEWTIAKNLIQDDTAGNLKAGIIILPNAGSEVSIPNGKIKKLVLYNPLNKYTIDPADGYTTLVTQITVKFNANGSADKFSSIKVFTGDKYEQLPTPTREGYTFDGWYTKASGGTKVTKGSVVSATGNITLYAHWTENLLNGKAVDIYSDVNSGDWFAAAVQFVYERQIMNGTGGNTFTPNGVLTRGQFVTVLYNLEGRPNISFKNDFDDVKEDDYFALPVIWANKHGIASGVGNRSFGPNQNITREQLATMLYNYSKAKEYTLKADSNALKNFSDKDKVSTWAKTAMQWAVTNKVMGGKSTNAGTVLDPTGKATRAECAQMIKNLYENVIRKK